MKLEIDIPDDAIAKAAQRIGRDGFREPYSSGSVGGSGYEAIRATVLKAIADYDFADKVAAEIERILPGLVAEIAKIEAGRAVRRRLKALKELKGDVVFAGKEANECQP
jgi:hypothetical protein